MLATIGTIGCLGYVTALVVIGGSIRQSTSKRATLPNSNERIHVDERKD